MYYTNIIPTEGIQQYKNSRDLKYLTFFWPLNVILFFCNSTHLFCPSVLPGGKLLNPDNLGSSCLPELCLNYHLGPSAQPSSLETGFASVSMASIALMTLQGTTVPDILAYSWLGFSDPSAVGASLSWWLCQEESLYKYLTFNR